MLIVASVAMLLPILYTVITSFEPSSQQFKIPPVWIPDHVTLHSYRLIF